MTAPENLLKMTFLPGLKDIVAKEISQRPQLQKADALYFSVDVPRMIRELKSILNVFVVRRGDNLNPGFISRHKSLLGDLIEYAIQENTMTMKSEKFRTFKLSCAGSGSEEVTALNAFVTETFKLTEAEEADMEIYIGKSEDTWEIGVRLTTRPVSVREYRVANIPGGLNPTVAYAMNVLAGVKQAGHISTVTSPQSYLNIFSGSATLLIEAGLMNPNISLVGFDIDKKTNSLAIQNIKKAGLIKRIGIKTGDMFDMPDLTTPHLGTLDTRTFDIITSDLPFGMQISKGEDLQTLYQCFVDYCEKFLHPRGKLVVYTSEYELLENILRQSKFRIMHTLMLKIPTSVNAYLETEILVLSFAD